MSHHALDQLQLDLCGSCGGVWYDAGEFQLVLQQGQKEVQAIERMEPPHLQPLKTEQRWTCPICAIPLHNSLFKGHAGVQVATCYGCAGLFVPADSLKVLDQLEGRPGGLSSTPDLTPDQVADIAQLNAQAAGDLYRAQLANYAWRDWAHHPLWSGWIFPF